MFLCVFYTCRNIRLLSEESIQLYNTNYYRAIDIQDEDSNRNFSSVSFPRHAINTETRTSMNDIYLCTYTGKQDVNISPSFEQEYELEFYTGSNRGMENVTSYSTEFDITLISQTSYESIQFSILVKIASLLFPLY